MKKRVQCSYSYISEKSSVKPRTLLSTIFLPSSSQSRLVSTDQFSSAHFHSFGHWISSRLLMIWFEPFTNLLNAHCPLISRVSTIKYSCVIKVNHMYLYIYLATFCTWIHVKGSKNKKGVFANLAFHKNH